MTEESPAKRGDAAWKEQRDAIAQRNTEAQRRGVATKQSRDKVAAASAREEMDREAQQLRDLNARISKQHAR